MLDTTQITYFSKQTIALAQQQVDRGGLPFSSIIVNQHRLQMANKTRELAVFWPSTASCEAVIL